MAVGTPASGFVIARDFAPLPPHVRMAMFRYRRVAEELPVHQDLVALTGALVAGTTGGDD